MRLVGLGTGHQWGAVLGHWGSAGPLGQCWATGAVLGPTGHQCYTGAVLGPYWRPDTRPGRPAHTLHTLGKGWQVALIHDANEGQLKGLKGLRNNLEQHNIWHKVQGKSLLFENQYVEDIGLVEASSQTGCLPLRAP